MQGRNKLIVLSMSANELIGCKIPQGVLKVITIGWAISDRGAINHSNLSVLEVLATLIGSHLSREPTASPVLNQAVKLKTNISYQFW